MRLPKLIVTLKNFNPRSRKESDCFIWYNSRQIKDFNPRSRKESDISACARHGGNVKFQSTLSQGERQYINRVRNEIDLFQSTLSQGERRTPL